MKKRVRSSGKTGVQGGFSLLEVMIALMILMIGLTAVMLVFAQGAALQARSKRNMDSARLAQSVASELQYLAKEYETVPGAEQGENRLTVDSHAGFSDQYSVEVSSARLDLSEQTAGNLSYQQAAYGIRITVRSTFRGEQTEDVYHTAVVVPK